MNAVIRAIPSAGVANYRAAIGSRRMRLSVLTTHPIQYHASWFRALARQPEIDLKVWYCHKATPREQAAAGFGVEFDWDVSLLDGYESEFLANVAADAGVSSFNGLDTPGIKEIIDRERYDALIINGWHYKSAWQAMRACWKTKTPVMARSDSHLHTERNAVKRMTKWPLYRWFIPKLDACLAVGKWSREYFLHYGASPERTFIVPHAVDNDYFSHEAERLLPQRSSIRANWGLGSDSTVFLFAGKFIEKKRPIDFVRAVARANQLGSRVAGLMVGDGPLRESCERLVKSEQLPVRFAGFLNQSSMSSAYVAADALVLPSDGGETWGLVVNEAMVCGLPCFVSDYVGCGPDMILPQKTGRLFPLGDIETLAALLREFAKEESQRGEMSRQAKERANAYSTATAVERTLEALQSVSRPRVAGAIQ